MEENKNMIIQCPDCGSNMDLSSLAEHPDLVGLVMATLAKRKKGKKLKLSEKERKARSSRITRINKLRARSRKLARKDNP